MVWLLNSYHCEDCDLSWTDEWFCGCDDECSRCRKAHSPIESEQILSDAEQLAKYGAFNLGRWAAPRQWNLPSGGVYVGIYYVIDWDTQRVDEDTSGFIDRVLNR